MISLQDFIQQMKQSLTQPLPGISAQIKMAPPTRTVLLSKSHDRKDAKPSAVLILFYPDYQEIKFILIERATYNGVHSGQIAFPGGQYEMQDANLKATALREANEETNISPQQVEIIGELTRIYIPPSHFDVSPFVGFVKEKPQFKVDNTETKAILEINIKDFINPSCQTKKTIRHRTGIDINVPCFYLNDNIVWGATAMVLSELLMIIKRGQDFEKTL